MTPADVSNGCSGGLTATWHAIFETNPPFEGCCDEHDMAYALGGSWRDRATADKKLRECIAEKGYHVLAWLVWTAVRLFGGPYWPHRYRWGHEGEAWA